MLVKKKKKTKTKQNVVLLDFGVGEDIQIERQKNTCSGILDPPG